MTHFSSPVRATLQYIGDLNRDNSPQSQWCQRTLGYLPHDPVRRSSACALLVVAAMSGMPMKRAVPEFNLQVGAFAAAERMLSRTAIEKRPGARMPFAFDSEDGVMLG